MALSVSSRLSQPFNLYYCLAIYLVFLTEFGCVLYIYIYTGGYRGYSLFFFCKGGAPEELNGLVSSDRLSIHTLEYISFLRISFGDRRWIAAQNFPSFRFLQPCGLRARGMDQIWMRKSNIAMELAGMVTMAMWAVFIARPSSVGADTAQDFCVGDLRAPSSPSGFACKGVRSLTSDDFAYTGLRRVGNTSNAMNSAVTTAFATDFPGLNGLGLSIARLDFVQGGVIPLHTHPAGSELLLVIQGSILAGFISSTDNVPYTKQLQKGDIMVFPKGVLHFIINSGKGNALAYASYGGPTPGLQFTYSALFGNNLPAAVVAKATFISEAEIKQLKARFGGK